MTTILFDASKVKPASRRFGQGLHRALPTYRADHSASDAAWLIADNARREQAARDLDRMVDELYAEREALARLEAGLCR